MPKSKRALVDVPFVQTIVHGGVDYDDPDWDLKPRPEKTYSTRPSTIFLPEILAEILRKRPLEEREGFEFGFLRKDELLEALAAIAEDASNRSSEISKTQPRVNARLRACALTAACNAWEVGEFFWKKNVGDDVIKVISQALMAGILYAEFAARVAASQMPRGAGCDRSFFVEAKEILLRQGKPLTAGNILDLGHRQKGKPPLIDPKRIPSKEVVRKLVAADKKARSAGLRTLM